MPSIEELLSELINRDGGYIVDNDSNRKIPVSFNTFNSDVYFINIQAKVVNNPKQ